MSIFLKLVTEIDAALTNEESAVIKDESLRNIMFEEHGPSAFLSPSTKSFPIANPTSGKPNCGMMLMALAKIKMNMMEVTKLQPDDMLMADEYRKAFERGNGLYEESQCNCSVSIQEAQEQLITLLDVLVVESEDVEGLECLL